MNDLKGEIEQIIKNIETKYHLENPNATKVKIKIINGYGWYRTKVGEEFVIWDKPDRFHSELFEIPSYYIAEGKYPWQGLVREDDIKFI